jgi:ribosome-associated heat shock protein Hsp15
LAAQLVSRGSVRLNGVRALDPAKHVRIADVLTIALDRSVRVLRVRAIGERRGPFLEAQTLFEDLSAARTEA